MTDGIGPVKKQKITIEGGDLEALRVFVDETKDLPASTQVRVKTRWGANSDRSLVKSVTVAE